MRGEIHDDREDVQGMTHEEIEATIERLKSMDDSPYNGKYESGHILIEFMHSALSTNAEFRDRLISLLRQADPDTHRGLPVDADGVPIRIGDTVWDGSGFEWKVDSIEVKCSKGNIVSGFFNTDSLTHHPPVTVESVLEEYVERWHDTLYDDIPALTAEYAKKIREVMTDD